MSRTPTLWTPADLAERLQVTTENLAVMRHRGSGPPFVKIGRQVRYVPAQVMQWLEERKQLSTKQVQLW